MKKALKVLAYIFGSLFLVLLLLLVFHDAVIKYGLRRAVDFQSGGSVVLTMEKFNLYLQEGNIMIKKPELIFKEGAFNENQNLLVQRISFENISIDQLDFKKLLLNRQIIAEEFLVDKPQFQILQRGVSVQSTFHPENLINLLNSRTDAFYGAVIMIGNIEVNYGSISLHQEEKSDLDPGLVDFTLIFQNFNTTIDSTAATPRTLFSDEFAFRIKNFKRELNSGYLLEIDSATFSTTKDDFVAGGIRLDPLDKGSNESAVGMSAGMLVLNDIGLKELRGMEDLTIRSVILSDGYLTNFQSSAAKAQNEPPRREGMALLAEILHKFELDTIAINDYSLVSVLDKSDTIIVADDISLLMTRIVFDSAMFSNFAQNISYDYFELQTGTVRTKRISGLDINYESLDYSNRTNELVIKGIEAKGETAIPDMPLEAEIVDFKVKGFSIREIQNRVRQEISIAISNPSVDIDLKHPFFAKSNSGGSAAWQNYFSFKEISIDKGSIKLKDREGAVLNLDGLDVGMLNPIPVPNDSLPVDYDELFVKYDNLVYLHENQNFRIETGSFVYDDLNLSIIGVRGYHPQPEKGGRNRFSVSGLVLEDIDLRDYLKGQSVVLGYGRLDRPVYQGSFHLTDKAGTMNFMSRKGFPVNLYLGSFDISNALLKLSLTKDSLEFNTTFDADFRIGDLMMKKGDSLEILKQQLNWDLNARNIQAQGIGHELKLNKLSSNSFTSTFSIDSLGISSTQAIDTSTSNIQISNAVLPSLMVSGLDYRLLLDEDSLSLNRLHIQNPDINVRVFRQPAQDTSREIRVIDLASYKYFSYDSLDISGFGFSFQNMLDSSGRTIRISDLEFVHHAGTGELDNLLKKIDFSFNEFSIKDTSSQKFVRIEKGVLSDDGTEFAVKNISGSNLSKVPGQEEEFGLIGTDFHTSGISFSGLALRNDLPSTMTTDKLYIDDFTLNLNRKRDLGKKIEFKLKLELLREFSKIMTSLRVNELDMGNVNFHYRTFDDTATNKIFVDSIGLFVEKIVVDTSMIGESEPGFIRSLSVDLKGKTTITNDSLYEIRTGLLHYDFAENTITIDSVSMLPRYPDSVIFQRSIYQTDRTIIRGDKIELNGLSTDELFKRDHIYFSSVNLSGFHFDLSRDKRYPYEPGKVKLMPREQLMSLEQKFTIDSIHVLDARLDYEEIDEKTGSRGAIFINDLNMSVANLTNNIQPDDPKKRIRFEGAGKIMGASAMNIRVYFPLYPDTVVYWLSGSSEKINLITLNSFTENLMGLGILQGTGSLDIPLIIANDSTAKGNLTFRYKKLRLALYDREKEQLRQGFVGGVTSFFINDLVLRSNNPRFARKPKVGQVYFERDTRKGVVNYLWKGILSGMLSTLGLNTKEQRQEKREMKKNQ